MLEEFDHAWVIDFEFCEPDGGHPTPWCGVGHCVRTGETRRWRYDDSRSLPIYTSGPRDVVVAYAAEAEGKCIRALGWPMPKHCIDLLPVFRCLRNRFGMRAKASLLDALLHFGLPGIETATKSRWREIAMRGGPFSVEEMEGLLRYCEADVTTTARLLPYLIGSVHLEHALLWGRYTIGAVSRMQYVGVPLDMSTFVRIRDHWSEIQGRLIVDVDKSYGVYENGTFKLERFRGLVNRLGLMWPRTPSGRLKIDDETFKDQTARYPVLNDLRELRSTLAIMRKVDLAVGPDGRNRTSLMPFASRTGRNQPSNSRFIFGAPKWLRSLICPPPGCALIQLDFAQQEFLIGAALSGDKNMLQAYQSGDPYMGTAILASAAPPGATKLTHPAVRAAFKTAVLGLQYGCGAEALGARLGNEALGRKLVGDHRRVYSQYWRWSEDQVDRVLLGGTLCTPFGWRIRPGNGTGELNVRSVANWPIQSAGADILRIATTAMVEHGIKVCAPIHDAVLIEAPEDDAEPVADLAERLMREASSVVIGVPCNVDRSLIPSGSHYRDERGESFSRKVLTILATL